MLLPVFVLRLSPVVILFVEEMTQFFAAARLRASVFTCGHSLR
jgi:hypothetical protein